MDSPKCGTDLDHCVVIVGYGTENGNEFWRVRNSWGEDWGESGYIKIIKNQNDICGINKECVFPTA